MSGIKKYMTTPWIVRLSLIPRQKLNSAAEVATNVENDIEYVNL
jgi:hypothetical protein